MNGYCSASQVRLLAIGLDCRSVTNALAIIWLISTPAFKLSSTRELVYPGRISSYKCSFFTSSKSERTSAHSWCLILRNSDEYPGAKSAISFCPIRSLLNRRIFDWVLLSFIRCPNQYFPAPHRSQSPLTEIVFFSWISWDLLDAWPSWDWSSPGPIVMQRARLSSTDIDTECTWFKCHRIEIWISGFCENPLRYPCAPRSTLSITAKYDWYALSEFSSDDNDFQLRDSNFYDGICVSRFIIP